MNNPFAWSPGGFYPTVKSIMHVVANLGEIPVDRMIVNDTNQRIVMARLAAIYLCKIMLDEPVRKIAEKFSRSEKYIQDAIHSAEAHMQVDNKFRELVKRAKLHLQ
jgi:chromosomal replication initiation ATPase DnaA